MSSSTKKVWATGAGSAKPVVFNDDAIDAVQSIAQTFQDLHQITTHRAADTAIHHLDTRMTAVSGKNLDHVFFLSSKSMDFENNMGQMQMCSMKHFSIISCSPHIIQRINPHLQFLSPTKWKIQHD